MTARSRVAPLALALAVALSSAAALGCRGPQAPDWEPARAPEAAAVLPRAAELLAEGEAERAHALLAEALASEPASFAIATALQDVEERLLDLGGAPPGFADAPGTAAERLRRTYRARAIEAGDARAYVLAARAEDDGLAALFLLDEALSRDARAATAHYGRAYVLFGLGRLREAGQALERALELEPGHVAARRLETRLAAANGRDSRAAALLEAWLARTEGDPRVLPEERIDAELDLAALELGLGETRRALGVLDRLVEEGELRGDRAVQAELLRAVALDTLGEHRGALDAAGRAAALAPDSALALVHEALLQDRRLGNPAAARRAWLAVVQRITTREGPFDPRDALLLLRARVELASLERGTPAPRVGEGR